MPKPPTRALGRHAVARHDALAVEQEARQGVTPRRVRRRLAAQRDGRGHRLAHQRPAAGGLRRPHAERAGARPPGGPVAPLPAQRAQRGERVVRDPAGPHQLPQGIQQLARVRRPPTSRGRLPQRRGEEIAVERGAARLQVRHDRGGQPPALVRRGGRRQEQREPVGAVQGDPAVVLAQAPLPHPQHLAGRAELVEQAGRVVAHAGGQDLALQHARRQRQALQLGDDLGQAARAAGRPADAVPAGQEAGQCGGFDRLDLAAQAGQRAPPQHPQDLRVAPLPLGAAGTELAAHDRAGREQESPAPARRRRPAGPIGSPARRLRNGPWRRAKRTRSAASGSMPDSRNAAATPTGSVTPSASR